MEIKEEVMIETPEFTYDESKTKVSDKKHYSMPINKISSVAQGFLNRISSLNDEDDDEARVKLNELIDEMSSFNDCSGDANDFHNFAVELARADEYRLACAVLDCGLTRFAKNVDLLADYLQFGAKCGLDEETRKIYKSLKKIPTKKYTWRGFSFQVEYIQYLIDQTDSEKQISAYENEIQKIIKDFKVKKPNSEEPYRLEADLYRSLNMEQEEAEILRQAFEKVAVCPKCALRYADLMLEIGNYDEACKAVERGKKDATQPQASVSEGYLYYLSALCIIALVSKESREYKEEEVKKIYSDFNLALKEFKGNKSYISVIKSKTNVLVSKTGIKVEDELEELSNLIAY